MDGRKGLGGPSEALAAQRRRLRTDCGKGLRRGLRRGPPLNLKAMAIDSDVFEAALALPEPDRARLAHELLLSLDAGEDEGADEAWVDEIERRLKQVDDGTAVVEDWDAVRDRISSRLRTMKR